MRLKFVAYDTRSEINRKIDISEIDKISISKIYPIGDRYFGIFDKNEIHFCKLTTDRTTFKLFKKCSLRTRLPDI